MNTQQDAQNAIAKSQELIDTHTRLIGQLLKRVSQLEQILIDEDGRK